ncbi:rho GTPase-activating protein 4 isoform X2 [Carettochelys insculpta]|uniref:rho GTPase-activating protein 4 isoform X2 n=1 Tax=Carettochelys insculpta TaxID=44489 RepID=UPI003EBB54DA
MSALGRARRERWPQAEYEAQAKELRCQLAEQQRGREAQAETRLQLLQDLGEFLRRRAELELEYSRGLEKLSERFTPRLRGAKELPRKEQELPSPLQCWQVLLRATRQAGRDHGALSEIYNGALTLQLAQLSDNVGHLAKKSRELEQQMQEEVLTMISELQMAMKSYQARCAESQSAENKLREAERQEEKRGARQPPELGGSVGGAGLDKGPRRTSLRKGERLLEKRQARLLAAQQKCALARNDYLLHLAATNALISSYCLRDVPDLLDCSDLGFHLSLGRLLRTVVAAEGRVQSSWQGGLQALEGAVLALDAPSDKARLMQANPAAYGPPPHFEYHPHEGDQVSEVQGGGPLRPELLQRLELIEVRLRDLSLETDEVNKTLQATLEAFGGPGSAESLRGAAAEGRGWAKRRARQQEMETFYLTKLELFLSRRSIGVKLQVKLELLRDALMKAAAEDGEELRAPPRMAAPRLPAALGAFPADLEEYVQKSGQAIPLVVESCVRFISLHGLHHEGVFRVPGSQMRVTEIREAFERGEDPLADGSYPRDLDSVAGVLKLFFRGLEKPLIPPAAFPELLAVAQLESPAERHSRLCALISRLPAPAAIVLRYLCAFLHHVSQHSEENMMGPYNLAVCFGPTLASVPPGLDPVAAQPHANEAIKCLIMEPQATFPPPSQLPGPLYTPALDEDCEDAGAEDNETEGTLEVSAVASQEVLELPAEAVGRFAYVGRSPQELSFQPGDRIQLLARASEDWWRGQLRGAHGLVPHKYISLSTSAEPGPRSCPTASDRTAPAEPPLESASRLRVNSEGGSRGRQQAGASPVRKVGSPFLDVERLPLPCPRMERGPLGLGPPGTSRPSSAEPPGTPQTHMEMDKVVLRSMDCVFKELLSRSSGKQGVDEGGPEPEAAPAGKRGPAAPKPTFALRSKVLSKVAGNGE